MRKIFRSLKYWRCIENFDMSQSQKCKQFYMKLERGILSEEHNQKELTRALLCVGINIKSSLRLRFVSRCHNRRTHISVDAKNFSKESFFHCAGGRMRWSNLGGIQMFHQSFNLSCENAFKTIDVTNRDQYFTLFDLQNFHNFFQNKIWSGWCRKTTSRPHHHETKQLKNYYNIVKLDSVETRNTWVYLMLATPHNKNRFLKVRVQTY